MAYSVPLFSTMNLAGIDINTATSYGVATSTNTAYSPEYPQEGNLRVGTTVLGTLDGQWVYCTAATAAFVKYDVVQISPTFTCSQVSTAATTLFGQMAGVIMATASTGQYVWVMTNGVTPGINVVTGVGANVPLYTSATAGRLTGTLATGVTSIMTGFILTTGSTGGTSAASQGAIVVSGKVGAIS